MTDENQLFDSDFFQLEHAKRDRRISEQQRRQWADGLLACLPDSLGYQKACTRQSRLAEQELLNRLVDDWKRTESLL
jgi:hypothetical protein